MEVGAGGGGALRLNSLKLAGEGGKGMEMNATGCTHFWGTLPFFLTFIYFWDRERQSMNGGEAEREGDTESETGSRLQAPSHQPRARRGARTHGPRDRDLAEVGRLTDCATQAPLGHYHFDSIRGRNHHHHFYREETLLREVKKFA